MQREMSNIWKDGMLGLIVGDALGVPVEFMSRTELMKNPVTGMREYGTHHQPRGTWSDDSSMALAELDSIRTVGNIDYTDMMERFSRWCMHGEWHHWNRAERQSGIMEMVLLCVFFRFACICSSARKKFVLQKSTVYKGLHRVGI